MKHIHSAPPIDGQFDVPSKKTLALIHTSHSLPVLVLFALSMTDRLAAPGDILFVVFQIINFMKLLNSNFLESLETISIF